MIAECEPRQRPPQEAHRQVHGPRRLLAAAKSHLSPSPSRAASSGPHTSSPARCALGLMAGVDAELMAAEHVVSEGVHSYATAWTKPIFQHQAPAPRAFGRGGSTGAMSDWSVHPRRSPAT